MKKVVLSTALAMAMATSSFAGWGLPSVPSMGASASVANPLGEQDIEAIFIAAKSGEVLMTKSTIAITGILVGSKAKEALEAGLNDAEKIQDPKEKAAKIAQLLKDADAAAIAAGESKEGQATLKKLSATQKTEAGKAIGNFALAGLVDFAAVKMSQDVMQRASADPMGAAMKFASKLSLIKDLGATLPAQATEIGKMSQSLFAIAKTGGLAVPTFDEKAVTEATKTTR
jgi:hypothetical protein